VIELDAEAVYHSLAARLREEVVGRDVRLVGVHTGGVWLARRLKDDLRVPHEPSTSRAPTSCWSTTCSTPAARCARR
jgi:pyrimidine operon attenuation protein/uracil phosphoribosyltransferase